MAWTDYSKVIWFFQSPVFNFTSTKRTFSIAPFVPSKHFMRMFSYLCMLIMFYHQPFFVSVWEVPFLKRFYVVLIEKYITTQMYIFLIYNLLFLIFITCFLHTDPYTMFVRPENIVDVKCTNHASTLCQTIFTITLGKGFRTLHDNIIPLVNLRFSFFFVISFFFLDNSQNHPSLICTRGNSRLLALPNE